MKIALIFPPLYGMDMPPLGIAYIAAKLLNDGHEVKVFCFNAQLYHKNKDKQFLWDWDSSNEWCNLDKINLHFNINDLIQKWSAQIFEFNPKMAGFSVNSHSRLLSNLLADKLKEKQNDLNIIFGGPLCSELIEKSEFNRSVDIYVRGEGEDIVSKIAQKISNNESIADLNLKRTVVKADGGFNDNGWSHDSININKIPFPALHLFNLDDYTNKSEIPIIFSRGCDYYCRFCTDKPMWGNYRMREADNIIEEMLKHSKMFGRKKFKCNDLMVNGDLNGLNELTDKMIKYNLNFEWGSMARARPDMNQEMFDNLKKAGCVYLTYGIESGARRVLSHMGKPPKKVVAQTLKRTYKSKIYVNTLWMVGYPAEGWLDILETALFLLFNRRYINEFVSVSSCYIPRQSLLKQQQESLKIEYKNCEWYIGNSNTPTIRELRRKALLYFAKKIGLYKGGIK